MQRTPASRAGTAASASGLIVTFQHQQSRGVPPAAAAQRLSRPQIGQRPGSVSVCTVPARHVMVWRYNNGLATGCNDER